MKNLFNISQEEQNRILYLHETATKKLYLSEQAQPTGWEKFACVPKLAKLKRGSYDANSNAYTINNVIYYNNGKKASQGTSGYTCNDLEFKSVIRVAPTTVEQITQGKGFLRRGDKGDLVKQLQQLLKNHPNKYFTDEPNGIFGPKTNDGVIKFQSEVMKMTNPDGKVGKITWSYLNNSEPITKKDISEPMTKKEISLPVNDKEYQLKQPSETPQVSQNTNTVTNTKVDVTPQVVDSKSMEPF
jgi:hypothetical protein